MITGTHILFFSAKPEADRAFFRDALDFNSIDVGGGWLIFAFPPAEAAVHPVDKDDHEEGRAGQTRIEAEIYLMCDDIHAETKRLQTLGVEFSPIETPRWGIKTSIRLPSGASLGLYQPKHPVACDLK